MGCFMACFGLSNKRKRRNTLYKVLSSGHHHHQLHKHANYQVLGITENSIIPYSHFRGRDGEHKEQNSVKSKKKKKKVTFNLNVQVYELNPTAYQVLNNEEEENKNSSAEPEGPSSLSAMRYPLNHRYYNCTDGYDEEDYEMAYEESDIDGYDDDDEFDDEYDWDEGDSDGSLGNDAGEVYDENSKQKGLEERTMNQKPLAPNDANKSGGDRSIDMHSVLCPVENLTQWKAIKAKVASSRNRRKENVPSEPNPSISLVSEATLNFSPCSLESNALQSKPLMPEMAVDASLSNWLVSPNYNASTIHCQ